MTLSVPSAELSRREKEELLRQILQGRMARGRTAPASPAQQGLWLLDQIEGGSAAYNIPVAVRIAGPLDADALGRALGEVVRRHESLRTSFREEDGAAVQVIAPFAGFTLEIDDLSHLDGAAAEDEARRRRADDEARPFDLSRGPLFRARLLRVRADEHVLLLCVHHIVSDGWSLGLIFRELGVLYGAYRQGAASPLPELGAQYADHALRQQEQLRGGALAAQLEYWRGRLAGIPALLELATDHARPAARSDRTAAVRGRFEPGVLERLGRLGREEGATTFMVLLAAWKLILARYAASHDVVVGSPAAGRTRSDLEGLVGFFVNMLVLRTDLSGNPTFRDLLRRVRESALGAFENQAVPFDLLVAEQQTERSLSYSPLFQVMFAVEEGDAPLELAGTSTQVLEREVPSAKFDLSLACTPEAGGGRTELAYSTDLFDHGTAERMLAQFQRVLHQVSLDADRPLCELALMDEGERRRVVEEWNQTDAERPRQCVHQLFEAQAARAPDAIALVHQGEELTYGELNARANRLAHRLIRLGVGPDVLVGLCVERSLEVVVCTLAVLKAGGAYVPLDPDYPAQRLRLMLADSAAPVLLARERYRDVVQPPAGVRTLWIEAEWPSLDGESAENPAPRAHEANLAYVVYTSGSSGTPKGVGLEHRSLANYVVYAARDFGLRPGDRMLQFHSLSFDTAAEELFAGFLSGATLVLRTDEVLTGSAAFWDVCRREGITFLDLPTAVWHSLVTDLETDPAVFHLPVRSVVIGGERILPDRLRAWRRVAPPHVRLLNSYGPTEATIAATLWNASAPARADDDGAVSIGRPLPNTRVYVLDAWLRPAPVGVPGELWIAGVQVTRGYLRRPALTAQRYLPDPFAAEPGARMYGTGDRVRWRADGTLEYMGRVDDQVKIRGYRIEPGEVQSVLLDQPGVGEGFVLVREDQPGERQLVAYLTGDAEPGTLRAGMRRRLPDYMVPAAFVRVERLPLTPNGKVDRKALPALERGAGAEEHAPPRTPVEEVLAGIWAEVLGLAEVGIHESFFALGGHSLRATRVVSRIRAALGVDPGVRALFEAPTVAELACRVEALRRQGLPAAPPLRRAEGAGPALPSFAQERIWFLDRLQPGGAFYNMPVALRLDGALDRGALERAFGELLRRHDALRTTFDEADGRPVQVTAPFAGFTLPMEDLSAFDAAEREARARRRADEEAARPFDLAAGPLFRARLLRLADDEHVLLMVMHHVVGDGWSVDVLLRELGAAYGAFSQDRPSPLPELPVRYADYAAWQREHLRGEVLERQVAWWKKQLAGAPPLLNLPTDRPRPAVMSFRGAYVPARIPAELTDELQALARREGATLFMVLLGAFQALLSIHSGSDDVVVGTTIAGRTRAELEPLVGLFMNTLPLRTGLAGDPPFRTVLARLREATLGAYENQDLPFERLVTELRAERSLAHSPVVQVLFELHNTGGPGAGLPGLAARPFDVEVVNAKADLGLALVPTANGLEGELTYATDLFEEATARRLLRQLTRVLRQVAARPDIRLSELVLLDDAERRQVVAEWNATDAPFPADRCIHQLFAQQAARTPDALAVTCGGQTLTFAELDARANRLAHHLVALGVGPEVRVGVCLERGPELLAAIFGVMKAGGAYVPLDPSHPVERNGYVLADAGVSVLLTAERLRDALPVPAGAAVVCLDAERERIAALSAQAPASHVSAENLAYVIYTSGSTGRPKGVAMHHRGVCNYIHWGIGFYGADAGSGAPVFTSMAVDLTITNLLPLFAGHPVHLLGEEAPVEALAEVLRGRPDFGLIKITPVHLSLLTPMLTAEEARQAARTLVIGADFLNAEPTLFWQDHAPGVRLMNEYGPTETVVGCSAYVLPNGRHREGAVPVGQAIQNMRFYVLDARMEPVPVGLPGELYIGGVGVARGYLGRAALTAEKFVPDAFSGEGARMYRTGDRARWLADGNLMILGRTDRQVKVRGFRVELGEVEAALRREPGVRESLCVMREDVPGDRRLVAYVVGDARPEELRERLRTALPEHMVPSAFVRLDALPETATGKLDPKTLPAPEYVPSAGTVAPRSEMERRVAEVWASVLSLPAVGVHENFFDLGGTSLLLYRVFTRLREIRGDLHVVDLFRHTTVESVAAYLAAEAESAPDVLAQSRSRADERRAARGRSRAG